MPSIYIAFLGYSSNIILNILPLLLIYLLVYLIDKAVLNRMDKFPNL